MDARNFDYDKSTNVRFRRLKTLVDAFEIDQEEKFNEQSMEWIVKTTLVIYKNGFKKESQGVGAMSVKDEKLGWAALPYASTTSLGRAISLLGIFEDDIATDEEVVEASNRIPQKKVIQDTKELLQQAQDFVNKKAPDVKESEVEPEVVDEAVEEKKVRERKLKHKYTRVSIENKTLTDIIELADRLAYGECKIKATDLPMKISKGNLFEVIDAIQNGVFLEKAREIVANAMQANVDKGLSADAGISAYLLEKFDFAEKPDQNITAIKVENMLENFLEGNRDYLSFIQSVWEPLQNEGYSDTQMTRLYEKMKKNGIFKFETIGMMFQSSPVQDLRKYISEVYKQKPQ